MKNKCPFPFNPISTRDLRGERLTVLTKEDFLQLNLFEVVLSLPTPTPSWQEEALQSGVWDVVPEL